MGRFPRPGTPRKICHQSQECKHTSLIFLVGKFCELRQSPLLGGWVNKGAPNQALRASSLLMSLNTKSGMPTETSSKTNSLKAVSYHGTTPGSCDPFS